MKSFLPCFLALILIFNSPGWQAQPSRLGLFPPVSLQSDTTTIYLKSLLGELEAGAVILPIGLSDRSFKVDTLMLTGKPKEALSVMTIETEAGDQQLLLLEPELNTTTRFTATTAPVGNYQLQVEDSSLNIISLGGPVHYLVFFNNQQLQLPCKKKMPPDCRIDIPAEARNMKRSYIRIFSWYRHHLGREMLIPLEYGEPILDPSRLNRQDWPGTVLRFQKLSAPPALEEQLQQNIPDSSGINTLVVGPAFAASLRSLPSAADWQNPASMAHILNMNIMLDCHEAQPLSSEAGAYRSYPFDGFLNCPKREQNYHLAPSVDYQSNHLLYSHSDSSYHKRINEALSPTKEAARKLAKALTHRLSQYGEHHLLLNRVGGKDAFSAHPKLTEKEKMQNLLLSAAIQFAVPGLPYLLNNDFLQAENSCQRQLQNLASLRRSKMSLMYGSCMVKTPQAGILAIRRTYFDEEVLILLNLKRESQRIPLKGRGTEPRALCHHFELNISNDNSQTFVTLPPMSYEYFEFTNPQP